MLESNYYRDYRGPQLSQCLIDGHDYTEGMREVYGPNQNWQGCLWTYKEILEDFLKLNDCSNTHFRIEFCDGENRTYWTNAFVTDKYQYYNPARL